MPSMSLSGVTLQILGRLIIKNKFETRSQTYFFLKNNFPIKLKIILQLLAYFFLKFEIIFNKK